MSKFIFILIIVMLKFVVLELSNSIILAIFSCLVLMAFLNHIAKITAATTKITATTGARFTFATVKDNAFPLVAYIDNLVFTGTATPSAAPAPEAPKTEDKKEEDKKEEMCIGSAGELYNELEKSVAAGFMASNPLKDKGFVPGDFSKENYEKIDLHRPYVHNGL